MKQIAFLRGINVGGNKKVSMRTLKEIFENLGYSEVSTYINSGNVIFNSDKTAKELQGEIEQTLLQSFGYEIPTLVIPQKKIQEMAHKIPEKWQNDDNQKTDVAFLFEEIDDEIILDKLPVRKEFLNMIYLQGAIALNVLRDYYNRSRWNKLASHKLYQKMTIRNINTLRFLAKI